MNPLLSRPKKIMLAAALLIAGLLVIAFADVALALSSRAQRQSKDVVVAYGSEGYSVGVVGDTSIIEFTYSGLERNEALEYRHAYQLGLKNFRGNSFYSRFTAVGRQSGERVFPVRKASQTDILLGVSIGNQWQWRYLTFGVDWASLLFPVAKIERTAGGDTQKDQRNKGYLARLEPAELRFLALSVGVAF